MDIEVESYFQKKFKFQNLKEKSWSCKNPFKNALWKIPDLENLKNHLNSTKHFLSHMETQRWHRHTSLTNHAGGIFDRVKHVVNPELLTQAWLKFYECLVQFDLVSNDNVPLSNLVFKSVHLCEAPGAFITSLNHYLKLCHPNAELNWVATTLNPYYEGNSIKSMIGDDRFIYHTIHHWNFGSDDTGDIMEGCNIQSILASTMDQGVHLITADGSVDCADNPGEQESHLSQLHWCETITALLMLSHGGSYVLKMFTLFEHSTVSLLYLLRLSFEEIHAFKPCTSKEGNSEVYIIAIRYKKTEEIERFLRTVQFHVYERKVDLSLEPLFSLAEFPEDFLGDVVRCATIFKDYQEQAILRNLTLYNIPLEDQNLETIKKKIADHYMQKYGLQRISRKNRIVSPRKTKCAFLEFELGHMKRSDSLNINAGSENFHSLQSELKDIDCLLSNCELFEWVNPNKKDWRQNICCTHGKAYEVLRNTRFCHARTFRIFETLHEKSLKIKSIPSCVEALLQENQNLILKSFLNASIGENENFEMKQIPVLSRFSVSTVWIISLLFDKIELRVERDPKIIFLGYQEDPSILNFMRELDKKLLNFVDIAALCRKNKFNLRYYWTPCNVGILSFSEDQFCDFVSYYNTALLLKFSLSLINSMPVG